MGALVEWVLGEAQHYDLLMDLQPYLGVPGVLPVLPLVLLGLGFARTFGVHLEPTFAPVLA